MSSPSSSSLELAVLPGELAVCRLDAHAPLPGWVWGPPLASVTRTGEKLSVICPADQVPAATRCQAGWRCLQVRGPLDFGLVGILAGLTGILAQAGIPIFALSTYDTDYLLVRQGDLAEAVQALRGAGHRVLDPPPP